MGGGLSHCHLSSMTALMGEVKPRTPVTRPAPGPGLKAVGASWGQVVWPSALGLEAGKAARPGEGLRLPSWYWRGNISPRAHLWARELLLAPN